LFTTSSYIKKRSLLADGWNIGKETFPISFDSTGYSSSSKYEAEPLDMGVGIVDFDFAAEDCLCGFELRDDTEVRTLFFLPCGIEN